jgi:hypothetical protein
LISLIYFARFYKPDFWFVSFILNPPVILHITRSLVGASEQRKRDGEAYDQAVEHRQVLAGRDELAPPQVGHATKDKGYVEAR